jgi:hypothetical protein
MGSTYQNDLEKHLLVHLHELHVPLVNLGGLLAAVVLLLGRRLVSTVLLAPLEDFAEDGIVDVGDGDGRLGGHGLDAEIINQVLDENGTLGDGAI